MASIPLWTYHDIVQYLLDSTGGASDNRANTLARMAVQTTFRELVGMCNWSYLFKTCRISTVAVYDTGTVVYDHTGGASERMLTLTTGTWPSWAARGEVWINSIPYRIETRESSSVVTLSSESNPGADVASTTYSLVRSRYTLPIDFRAGFRPREMASIYGLDYITPQDLELRKTTLEISGDPRCYSYINDPDYVGAYAVEFYPAPGTARTHTIPYLRQPRKLSIVEYTTGTVTASASSTSVTGTGTAWTDSMVGSVIRFGDTSNIPDGVAGLNPAVEERIITAVGSATALTVDTALANSYTAVKYRISDLVDIEEATMLDALLAGCEAKFARGRVDPRNMAAAEAAYRQALRLAKAADARNLNDIVSGPLATQGYVPDDTVDWSTFET